jgi:hypothetical protein
MTGEYEQTFVSIMRVQFIEKILTLLMSSKGLLTQKYVRLQYANIEIIMLDEKPQKMFNFNFIYLPKLSSFC